MNDQTTKKLKSLSIYIGALSLASISLYFTSKTTKKITKKKKIEKKEEHFEDLKTKLNLFYENKQPKTHLIGKNKNFVKRFFDKFDTDKNGVIDEMELHQLLDFIADKLNTKKPTKKEVLNFFDKIDTDHSGNISLDEFENFLDFFTQKDLDKISLPDKFEMNTANLKKLFNQHDQNLQGFLDTLEFSLFLEDLSHSFDIDEQKREKIKFASENISKRDKILFEEFEEFLLAEQEVDVNTDYEVYDQNSSFINLSIPFFL